MTEIEDQALESGAEEALDLTETPQGEPPVNDPFDSIEDEGVRAEAKKFRAIARRKEKSVAQPKEETPKEEKPETPKSEFLTKEDFFKSNEKKAIKEATADPEVKANWAKIVPFFASRRGRETPEDILEDIKDAITLYKARNPETEQKVDPAAPLKETTAPVGAGGGVKKKEASPQTPPGYQPPSTPKTWYPPKQ